MLIDQLFSLKNKTALVTGASRGLGFAIAKGFAGAGANVAVASRSEEEAQKAARNIEAEYGNKSIGVHADVSETEDVEKLFATTLAELGPIDILMTNAGIINRPRQNVWEIEDDVWDQILNINLKGTFLCCRKALQEMLPRKSGKIICMASIMSVIAQTGHSPYIASKGGINQFVKALALEAAPYNINVNAIGPTYIRSELVDVTLRDHEKEKDVLNKLPLGRVGEPEDLIGACIFLASDASNYITGHLLMIDGGHTIH